MKCNTHSMVTNTANSELEFSWSRILCPDDWSCRRNGDETSLAGTRTRGDLREPCQQSVCEGMGIQTRFGTNETCHVEVHVCARRGGEEVDESRILQYEAEQSRFDDKVSHI